MISCLNLTARDGYVYESLNKQELIVGQIAAPFIDFEALDKVKQEIKPYRECQIEHGEDKIQCINGEFEYKQCDLYISDNFWLVCNFSCPYCLTDSPEFTASKNKFIIKADVKLEFLRYISEQMHKRNEYYHYRIFGGEPTTYPEFDKIISYLDQDTRCNRMILSTNASLDDKIEMICDMVKRKDQMEINVSIHPLDAKFDWVKTKSRIKRLYDEGFGIYTIGVITALTHDSLLTMSKELKNELGFGINLFHNLRPEKMIGA